MNLKILSIQELDQRIKTLVQSERDLLREVLLTIKEIDTRKMYLDLGFSSLFAYLVSIGYQGGSAQRRIDAVRLMKEIPDLPQKIQTGDTSLNQVSLLQKAIRQSSKKITSTQKESLLAEISTKTRRESEKTLANFFQIPVVDAEFQKAQADDSVRVEITINKELYEQIQEAQEYLSHSLPNQEIKSYLEYLTNKVLKQKYREANKKAPSAKKKTEDQIAAKAEIQAQSKIDAGETTQIKAAIKIPMQSEAVAAATAQAKIEDNTEYKTITEVKTNQLNKPRANHFRAEVVLWHNKIAQPAINTKVRQQILRTYKECQYTNPKTGQQCKTRWHLQVDHKQSRWAGGLNEKDNLQVLCAGHNQLKYRQENHIRNI